MYKTKIQYFAIAFAAIISLQTIAIAEDNGRRIGKHSVQISMDDLLKFSSLYGGIISYKRHFNTKNALRLGFLLSGKIEERIDTIIDNDRLPLVDLAYDTTKTASIGVHLHYLKYLIPNKLIKFYFGAGPNLRYSYNYRYGREVRDTTRSIVHWDKNKNYDFAIDGFAGFEWIFIDNISLLFEYPVSVAYSITKLKSSRDDGERKQQTNRWLFEYSNLKFGFCIYF